MKNKTLREKFKPYLLHLLTLGKYLHTVAVIFKLSTYFEKKMMLLPLNGQKGVVDAVT